MKKVIIINLSKKLLDDYLGEEFYSFSYSLPLIKNNSSEYPYSDDCSYNLTYMINYANIVFSDYKFISPTLGKNYNFIELCISKNDFKFYNFDENLFSDILNDFKVYKNLYITKQYHLLIYRFLSLALMDKPINIKSGNNIFEENTDL